MKTVERKKIPKNRIHSAKASSTASLSAPLEFAHNAPQRVTRSWVKAKRPHPQKSSNKTQRGHSLLIAGSTKYLGAAVLCAKAALRAGSGYVELAHARPPVLALKNPDFLVTDLLKVKLADLKYDAVGIGPGLGVNRQTKEWIKTLIKLKVEKVVIDADAITVCAEQSLFPLPSTWIATPHAGELSRVLKVSSKKIEADRETYALKAEKKMGCQVLLKGYHPLLASGQKLWRVPTGNPALAKSGTGDVLTGMIVAMMAQGLGTREATLLAAYLHGAVADDWVRAGNDAASFLASDLIEGLPKTLRKF